MCFCHRVTGMPGELTVQKRPWKRPALIATTIFWIKQHSISLGSRKIPVLLFSTRGSRPGENIIIPPASLTIRKQKGSPKSGENLPKESDWTMQNTPKMVSGGTHNFGSRPISREEFIIWSISPMPWQNWMPVVLPEADCLPIPDMRT